MSEVPTTTELEASPAERAIVAPNLGMTLAVDGGVVLALITGYLYCASTARWGGYLGELRLDGDVLDRGFHQVVYDGFLNSLSHLVGAFFVAFFLAIGLAMAVSANRASVAAALRKVMAEPTVEQRLVALAFQALLVAVVLVVLVVSLVFIEERGQEQARNLIDKVEKGEVPLESYISTRIGDKEVQLVALACGSRNCAGMDQATRTVYYFPQNGHSFRHPSAARRAASAASAASGAAAPFRGGASR